jgi:hypothetical protein
MTITILKIIHINRTLLSLVSFDRELGIAIAEHGYTSAKIPSIRTAFSFALLGLGLNNVTNDPHNIDQAPFTIEE